MKVTTVALASVLALGSTVRLLKAVAFHQAADCLKSPLRQQVLLHSAAPAEAPAGSITNPVASRVNDRVESNISTGTGASSGFSVN